MSFRVKPSSQFRADLSAVLTFISEDDVSGARHVQSELNRKIELLRLRPLIFRLRNELGDDFRVVLVFNYLLVYHVTDNTVFLDRLMHSAQDFETIFGNDDNS